jgi:hypothetical protein
MADEIAKRKKSNEINNLQKLCLADELADAWRVVSSANPPPPYKGGG